MGAEKIDPEKDKWDARRYRLRVLNKWSPEETEAWISKEYGQEQKGGTEKLDELEELPESEKFEKYRKQKKQGPGGVLRM
jgi:hypothetical protein